ncbi:MAG: hypothetical protein AAFN12_13630 [Cyanobacteria bacterium J06560_2]
MIVDAPSQEWSKANQQFLTQALLPIRRMLVERSANRVAALNAQMREALNDDFTGGVLGNSYDGKPFSLDYLIRRFGLSDFEISILLLCAAIELDPEWPQLCASVSGLDYPTFGLAMDLFAEADWQCLSPSAPLRRFHFIEVGAGDTLLSSPLRIDEQIVHYLKGVQCLDVRLQSLLFRMDTARESAGDGVSPSSTTAVKAMIDLWSVPGKEAMTPFIQLTGTDSQAATAAFGASCHQLKIVAYDLSLSMLPADTQSLQLLISLCERANKLGGCAFFLDCEMLRRGAGALVDAAMLPVWGRVEKVIDSLNAPLVVLGQRPFSASWRSVVEVEMR